LQGLSGINRFKLFVLLVPESGSLCCFFLIFAAIYNRNIEPNSIYMNFKLSQIPDRNLKPRQFGLTMVMDKGLSVEEAKNFMSASHPHVDIVKLGFGTSFVTPNLKEKLEIYRSYDIPVYFGGTLFEAFLIRNQFDDYINVCKEFGISYMEVSDGSINIPHAEKCGYIEKLTKHGTVLSEVGSKDAAHIIPPYKWIDLCDCRSKRSRQCRYLPG
jgi:phosphosulfolactate synthase